jgi:hypothetical protein
MLTNGEQAVVSDNETSFSLFNREKRERRGKKRHEQSFSRFSVLFAVLFLTAEDSLLDYQQGRRARVP